MEIDLSKQNLTELTEKDLILSCELKKIKPEKLEILDLYRNKLTNLDFIQPNTPFINLRNLYLEYNNITDMTNIKYLNNLYALNISDNPIKDMDFIKNLKDINILDINNLKLENEEKAVEILKSLGNVESISCVNTFKKYNKKSLMKNLKDVFYITV